MKVILTERVPSLGNVGEIVNVTAGHARNYLFPNQFAVLADESNRKALDNQKRRLGKKVQAEKNLALGVKKQLEGFHLDLIRRVGANGKLFGSVTTSELSTILAEKGIQVERRLMTVDMPIKALGNYKVKAKLFPEVEALFTVKVSIDPTQAEELKAKALEAQELKKKQEEDAKLQANAKADADAAATEMTEEQRLKAEADRLLRS